MRETGAKSNLPTFVILWLLKSTAYSFDIVRHVISNGEVLLYYRGRGIHAEGVRRGAASCKLEEFDSELAAETRHDMTGPVRGLTLF